MRSITDPDIEFRIGESFLFAAVCKWAIELIDAYTRWEVLVNLERHIHFLNNPLIVPIILLFGLILIHRSLQRQIAIASQSPATLRDASGQIIPRKFVEGTYGVWITVLIVFGAVAAAFLYAVIWIMTYNPIPPPPIAYRRSVPKIFETENRILSKPKIAAMKPPIVVNAPGGIPIVGNRGVVTNPTINNYTPPSRRLSDEQRNLLAACLKTNPGKFAVGAIANNGEAYRYAQDWSEVFSAAGWSNEQTIPVTMIMIAGGMWSGLCVRVHGEFDEISHRALLIDGSPEKNALECIDKAQIGGGVAIPFKDKPTC